MGADALVSDISDSMLLAFVNDAVREIYNSLGTNAYFLRKTESVNVAEAPDVTTLPSYMARLHKLEVPHRPGAAMQWKMIRKAADGSLTITADRAGPYIAHYLELQPELTALTDPIALPAEHIEVLVVGVCKRIAASVGNAPLLATYAAEYDRLLRICRRDCQKYDGMRHDALVVSRSQWGTTTSILASNYGGYE